VISAVRAEVGLIDGAEITLEANPGTVHERSFERFVAAGVNRFSIGVQSFDDRELSSLGRIHGAQDASRAVKLAKQSGARVSLDLIYALSGQTWDSVSRSIDAAVALEPDHISAYTLTVEPGTMLARQQELGRFEPLEDDAQADLIERVTGELLVHGFVRYEISSYAQPGQAARHNTIYWVGGPYLGIGAGAHSYLPGPSLRSALRRSNLKSPEEYQERALAGTDPVGMSESLGLREVLGDRLMVGFRIKWGLDLAGLEREAGLEGLAQALTPTAEALAQRGLLRRSGARWAPTPSLGFLFADEIARRFLAELDRALTPGLHGSVLSTGTES
jgi:oxygen-independent coproporphyrinogen-3 oxidase